MANDRNVMAAICPICLGSLEGLTPGFQVAAAVLLAVLLVALTLVGRVVWRVWTTERHSATALAQNGNLSKVPEAGA